MGFFQQKFKTEMRKMIRFPLSPNCPEDFRVRVSRTFNDTDKGRLSVMVYRKVVLPAAPQLGIIYEDYHRPPERAWRVDAEIINYDFGTDSWTVYGKDLVAQHVAESEAVFQQLKVYKDAGWEVFDTFLRLGFPEVATRITAYPTSNRA